MAGIFENPDVYENANGLAKNCTVPLKWGHAMHEQYELLRQAWCKLSDSDDKHVALRVEHRQLLEEYNDVVQKEDRKP